MKLLQFRLKPLGPVLIAASLASACGGGGSESPALSNQTQTQTGSQSPGGNLPPVADPGSGATSMTMSCVDGPTLQCSGGIIIRTENGVGLTRSGVQAYGKSTSDLANPIVEKTTAYGMAPASGGTAEVRLAKDGNGVVSEPRLLLSKLGISWNGEVERPQIIETFRATQARIQIGADGKLLFSALPISSDSGYYDFADKGTAATQANYANNAYFPRGANNPPRCVKCENYESTGAHYRQGDWRTGGSNPDITTAVRLHGDGDVHAGDGKPDANGNPTILPGGSGIGVPFPGSKGYRGFDNWSYKYGNLSTWVTQDTVSIVEWAPGSDEHSTMRRGAVAFGDVSNPAEVPANGTATYSGIAYGWYTSDGSITRYPSFFRAAVSVTVNFATRAVSVSLRGAFENVEAMPPLPAVDFQATPKMGATGANTANYFTGPLGNGSMTGGVSGRYFGPIVAGGTKEAGPAELGGAFSMSNSSTGAAVVGGFIALKG
jgi:hypothetical protein